VQRARICFAQALREAADLFQSLHVLEPHLADAVQLLTDALSRGGKVLACGNGGSASQAQHFVGELMGRYKKDRNPLPAIALTADSTVLTCIGNDYRFEDLFARQISGLAAPEDVLVAFSTSGNSRNVVRALEVARSKNLKSIAFLGAGGGPALPLADCTLLVPHNSTARIQEAHQFLMHCLMDEIETVTF
jgi:D-sedoheptulose 7-phosphate isomerase